MSPHPMPQADDDALAAAIPRARKLLELIERQALNLDNGNPDAILENAEAMRAAVEELEALAPRLRGAASTASPECARLADLLAECRARNAATGPRIDALARHTRRALALLCGQPDGTAVYGPRGVEPALATSRYNTRA